MFQLIVAVISTIAIVLFAMANTHHVQLSYVFGEPIRVRMIFLVASAFTAGIITTYLYQLVGRMSRRPPRRRPVDEGDAE